MSQKVSKEYKCEACDYVTCKKSDYTKHLLTRKHTLQINTNGNSLNIRDFKCECGKIYKHQSSLWNHKKNCKKHEEENKDISEISSLKEENVKEDDWLITRLMDLSRKLDSLHDKFDKKFNYQGCKE